MNVFSDDKSEREKLNRQNRGRTVYYTVQETIEDIYGDLIEGNEASNVIILLSWYC